MKIGIFDPYLNSLSGGEKYMLTLASCLASKHNVSIFWERTEEKIIKEKAHKKLNIDLSRVAFTKNIFAKDISFFSRLQESKNFDYIIFLSDGSIPVVFCKLVVHFQFPVEWIDGKSIKSKLKLLGVKKIICNSYFTKSFIDKKFGVHSTVLYPPADTAITLPFRKENLILHVGRFGTDLEGSNYKKQDIMIEVFKEMVKKGLRDWRFVLIISFPDEDREKLEELKAAAKNFPIRIVENPKNQEVKAFYAKAKIYWHASGFGENLYKHPEKAEHFGIATVEAMAYGGVPVVIDAGGQPEIVEHRKNGFLWNTTEELIEYTNFLVRDSRTLSEMSKLAITKALYFSKERFCQQAQKILE